MGALRIARAQFVIQNSDDMPFFRMASGDNTAVVFLGDGESRFLFSYGVLVAGACNWRHPSGERALRDVRKYSKTTSAHVNKFFGVTVAAEVGRAALVDFFTAELARVVAVAVAGWAVVR